jgi:ankyrin repeat protein
MEEELHNAAAVDDVVTIRRLVAEGADVNEQGAAEGVRPLHVAAQYGHVDAVQVLVEIGADLEAPAVDGVRPLHMAAHQGHVSAVKTLVQLGADKEASTANGFTPLLTAACTGACGSGQDVGGAGG